MVAPSEWPEGLKCACRKRDNMKRGPLSLLIREEGHQQTIPPPLLFHNHQRHSLYRVFIEPIIIISMPRASGNALQRVK